MKGAQISHFCLFHFSSNKIVCLKNPHTSRAQVIFSLSSWNFLYPFRNHSTVREVLFYFFEKWEWRKLLTYIFVYKAKHFSCLYNLSFVKLMGRIKRLLGADLGKCIFLVDEITQERKLVNVVLNGWFWRSVLIGSFFWLASRIKAQIERILS